MTGYCYVFRYLIVPYFLRSAPYSLLAGICLRYPLWLSHSYWISKLFYLASIVFSRGLTFISSHTLSFPILILLVTLLFAIRYLLSSIAWLIFCYLVRVWRLRCRLLVLSWLIFIFSLWKYCSLHSTVYKFFLSSYWFRQNCFHSSVSLLFSSNKSE